MDSRGGEPSQGRSAPGQTFPKMRCCSRWSYQPSLQRTACSRSGCPTASKTRCSCAS